MPSAGLFVTECTQISTQAHGIIRAPGLHRADQIAAWCGITDAVHGAGGRIYCQIWHCGRVAHPDIRGGTLTVGPSPIAATGDFFLPTGRVDLPIPRELAIAEYQESGSFRIHSTGVTSAMALPALSLMFKFRGVSLGKLPALMQIAPVFT